MAKETNWHKHVAIVTYLIAGLTLILIFLAVLTFVHPPDPANPMSFDFLSRSIVIPWWLAAAGLLLVGSLAALTARFFAARRSSPRATQASPAISEFFQVNPTSLEQTTVPTAGIGYPAKLRLSLKNVSGQIVKVLPLSWLTSTGNISVQTGAAPYPGVTYKDGMMDFAYFYQLEEYLGSWKSDKWKRAASGAHDEQIDLAVNPGETFRIWVGLNPCVPPANMERLRKTHSLGTIILPVRIANDEHHLKLQV